MFLRGRGLAELFYRVSEGANVLIKEWCGSNIRIVKLFQVSIMWKILQSSETNLM